MGGEVVVRPFADVHLKGRGVIATLLHDPDLYAKNPARFDELTRKAFTLRAEKDAAEHRWLEVAEMAEQLATAR